MNPILLSMGKAFASPSWGSNFVVFCEEETIAEQEVKVYLKKVCQYAKHHQVYLVPQRFFLMGYQNMCLISPKGKVLGAQRAIYRHASHIFLQQETTLDVLDTEFGRIALCVDVDIYKPEVARTAERQGAQYLICSQRLEAQDYRSSSILTGAWNAAQANALFVITACNHFHCVCAPNVITAHQDGFVVMPSQHKQMPATRLDAGALAHCCRKVHVSKAFYQNHRNDW